jgi:hypothetical protein
MLRYYRLGEDPVLQSSYIEMNTDHDIKFNVMAMAPSFSDDFF